MKKLISSICVLLLSATFLYAQDSDDQYKKPLKEVLQEIESKFHVRIKFTDALVKDKFVNYAQWRFRNNLDETLDNVLTPLDMKVNKEGEGVYKLKEYEYYRWPVQEGWKELDRIAAQYHDKASWEKRKDTLKPCLYKALELSPMPAKPNSKPIITAKKNF